MDGDVIVWRPRGYMPGFGAFDLDQADLDRLNEAPSHLRTEEFRWICLEHALAAGWRPQLGPGIYGME